MLKTSNKFLWTTAQPAPLSLLRDHKFKNVFQDTVNPLCSRSLEAESTYHFFLRFQNFTNLCICLMKELIKIDSCILTLHVFYLISNSIFNFRLNYLGQNYAFSLKVARKLLIVVIKFNMISDRHWGQFFIYFMKQTSYC